MVNVIARGFGWQRAGWLVLALLTASGQADAQSEADKRKAASLMVEGDDLVAKQDLEKALKSYQGADKIMGVPSTRIAVARTLARLGKLMAARDVASEVVELPASPREPRAFLEARSEAVKLIADLDGRIPTLLVKLTAPEGATTELRLDGETLAANRAQKLDPGTYELTANGDGLETVTREVTLKEGDREQTSVTLSLGSTPDETPARPEVTSGPGLRIGSYVALGLGVVGTGLGTYFAVQSGKRSDESDEAFERCGSPCTNTNPESANVERLDGEKADARSNAILSFIGGGVALATGVVLFIISAPESEQKANASRRVQPWIGYRSVGLSGHF